MCFNFTYKRIGNITCVNDGQFYYGPNTGVLWFNIILFLIFTGLAWGPATPHPAASAIGGLFCLVCLYFLLQCGLTDPGIIPRKPPRTSGSGGDVGSGDEPPATTADRELQMRIAGEENTRVVEQPLHSEVVVECKHPISGKTVKKTMELAWCYTCNLQRPLRASHCRWCDCCILRHDHHCPWTGQCVGLRNYRHFFWFVQFTTLYCLYMMGCMIWSMRLAQEKGEEAGKSGSDAFFHGMNDFYYCPFPALLCAIIVLGLVGGLACYHCNLTSENMTTHEDLRRYYWQLRTPFDEGSCCRNCDKILCGDLGPSMMTQHIQSETGGGGGGVGGAVSAPLRRDSLNNNLHSSSNSNAGVTGVTTISNTHGHIRHGVSSSDQHPLRDSAPHAVLEVESPSRGH